MSTHNICISREIRKILCGYPLLSVAMLSADSRRVDVSYWQKYVHKYWLTP